tara:strand:- start:4601 stop:5806 length:1206 start_codon:yes stop_codon:yes gene_type:complete
MTSKIKEIYDLSFIRIKTNTDNNFDMQGNNIYQANKLLFTDNNNFMKYKNNYIFTIDKNNDISTNIYSLNAKMLETKNYKPYFNYLNINDLSINYLTSDSLTTSNLILNNTVTNPTDFSNIIINNYKAGNLTTKDASINILYSQNFRTEIFNINKTLNIYNNSININSDNSFNIFKINDNNILSYIENNIIIDNIDNNDAGNLTSTVIYGKLKCHTIFLTSYTYNPGLINPLELEHTIVDNILSSGNSYSDLLTTDYSNITNLNEEFIEDLEEKLGKAFFGNMVVNFLTTASDDRLKHNEEPIIDGLNIINKLKPKTYIKRNNIFDNNNFVFKRCSGYIAQDISNDIPEISHVVNTSDKILSVNYNAIQPYITRSIQELDVICNDIKNKTNNLLQQVELLI